MGIKNCIFSLQGVNRIQDDGQWSTDADVYLRPSPYRGGVWTKGYWQGGDDSERYRQRFDFASDTTTMTAGSTTLQWPVERGAGAGNLDYGFAAGGDSATPGGTAYAGSKVQRMDYANDEANNVYRGNMTIGVRYTTGVGTLEYGYWCGGSDNTPSLSQRSEISRTTYANDTNAVAKGNLNNPTAGAAATGNQSYGYIGGGDALPSPSVRRSWVDRIDYSNDTATTSPKGPLDTARKWAGATGNASYGYFAGGDDGTPNTDTTATNDRVDYSNDTATATPKGALTEALYGATATGTASYGYWAGGYRFVPAVGWRNRTNNDRLDYSSDTTAMAPKGELLHDNSFSQAVSTQCWGMTGGTIVHSTGTEIKNEGGGPPETSMYGYWMAVNNAACSRIDFANDTQAQQSKGTISVHRRQFGATGNADYGYGSGGRVPAPQYSTTDRMTYANDTAAMVIKGPLTIERYDVTGVGNANYGYFCGGYHNHTCVDRLDYASDSTLMVRKGDLPYGWYDSGGTGTQDYGYLFGGRTYYQELLRIDYSSDTSAAPSRISPATPGSREGNAGTGDTTYAYFCGGGGPGSSTRSTTSRITYANDTATELSKGPIFYQRGVAGVTGKGYGYYGGGMGYASNTQSIVMRVDYSNDTANASIRAPLTAQSYTSAGVSARGNGYVAINNPVTTNNPVQILPNTLKAYWGGGDAPGSGGGSQNSIWKTSYANDTTVRCKGVLLAGKEGCSGNSFSSVNYGYFAGGDSYQSYPPTVSWGFKTIVERLDYANDDADTVKKGNLSQTFGQGSFGVGNASYGYFGGGWDWPAPAATYNEVDRIDYSSDTSAAAPKGPLSMGRGGIGATGNQSYGWMAGGMIFPSWGKTSRVDRIDYSSDTSTASTRGNLPESTKGAAGVGNADYGYFAGGESPYASSQIFRVDYSSDLSAPTPKGSLALSRMDLAAASSLSYGYFCGGGPVPSVSDSSTVSRYDFSNDTGDAIIKSYIGAHTREMSGVSATSNANPQ